MNLAVKKVELIEWLIRLENQECIKKIEVLKKEAEADWWDALTKDQQEDIEAGVADLESGRKKDFKKALAKYR